MGEAAFFLLSSAERDIGERKTDSSILLVEGEKRGRALLFHVLRKKKETSPLPSLKEGRHGVTSKKKERSLL